jgi:hypothetical protein
MKYPVPTSQRTVFSLTKTSLVMLYRKVIAIYLGILLKLFSLLKRWYLELGTSVLVGLDCVVGISLRSGGSNPGGGEIFSTRPDPP